MVNVVGCTFLNMLLCSLCMASEVLRCHFSLGYMLCVNGDIVDLLFFVIVLFELWDF